MDVCVSVCVGGGFYLKRTLRIIHFTIASFHVIRNMHNVIQSYNGKDKQVKLRQHVRHKTPVAEMICHCCHWVEVDAQVEVEMDAAPIDAPPPTEASSQPSQIDAVVSAENDSPPTEHPQSPVTVPVDDYVRAGLRHIKELTEEGLLTESEASTLRLEFMRSRLA